MSNYTPNFDGAARDQRPTGSAGKAIQGALFDAEFERIQTAVNSKADQTTVNAITSVPTAAVLPFGGTSAPAGFLLCNGQAVNRTAFSALFAAVGTAFGGGDGETTFNVPDLGGRVIAGREATADRLQSGGVDSTVIGENGAGGSDTHLLLSTESGLPAHNHTFNYLSYEANSTQNGGSMVRGGTLDYSTSTAGPANAQSPHNNVQPTMMMNFIIKT